MVKIPYIKIPSVRVGSIGPTSNIGTGGATPAPPTPITYLTQWKIVGNSEVHGQEIWSCGEYSATDGKYHILVQPQGGSIADIALDEPLRKVNYVADTIEFPVALEAFCNTDGSQIQTTLPDDTILHIQNLVTGIDNISTSYLTVTKNNNGSVTLVGNNNTGNYQFRYIGSIISTPTLNNTYFMTGVAGGSKTKYDIRYGGNLACYDDDNLLKVTVTSGQSNSVAVMLRDGNSIDVTLFILMLCINDMFADATDYIPTNASDFRTMFPNLTYIENTANTIDVIVKGGKLYKYVDTDGKALVTRNLALFSTTKLIVNRMDGPGKVCITTSLYTNGIRYESNQSGNILCDKIDTVMSLDSSRNYNGECIATYVDLVMVRNGAIEQTVEAYQSYFDSLGAIKAVYQLATPTTELVDAPQIAEADSYTCVISQGGKAVEWSSFETNSE